MGLMQMCRGEIPERQVLHQDLSLIIKSCGTPGPTMTPRICIEVTKDYCVER